ncbi:MAG: hypothetical protein HY723_02825 [Chloroflexi bacterium]|nr:hypothetical protein [Chloroflexota bacterium]
MRRFSVAAQLALLAAALLLAACRSDSAAPPSPTSGAAGAPRSFALGLSSLPAELTDAAYERAFALAAEAGEVVLIQRTPPWTEMLTGDLSASTAAATRREIDLASQYGLDLFVAIDPTDVAAGRGRLVDLPDDLRGVGFADPSVRRAFTSYALYVAENYRPRYLALGVEINSYQLQRPEDFESLLTLYAETYDAVKERSPETLVFPVFQLERLKGILASDEPYLPQWALFERFEPRLDLVALSSYPSLIFASPAHIPPSYYAEVLDHTDRPVALAGIGYSSETGPGASASTEEDQAAFVHYVLQSAGELEMPLVVWFVGQDPTFTGTPPFDLLQHIGLVRQDGTEKPAWTEWEAVARRPYVAAGP